MIDFWIVASLLALLALSFVLLPLLRPFTPPHGEDRTALNVALYKERLGELEIQQVTGVLSDVQWEQARAEAARELLGDTAPQDVSHRRLGPWLPLLLALLVPIGGFLGYLHWGAAEQVALSRVLSHPPESVDAAIPLWEQVVEAQPEVAEGWYRLAEAHMELGHTEQAITAFERTLKLAPEASGIWDRLGQAYMAVQQPGKAANAFEQAVRLAGRDSRLLGQWLQAAYFALGRQWSAELQAVASKILDDNPREVTTLGLLGIVAFEEQRYSAAIDYWRRLQQDLPAEDPSRQAIQGGIDRAQKMLSQSSDALAVSHPAKAALKLQVAVTLGARAQAKVHPNDKVFVFVRAANTSGMPLAVKRLSVADLPQVVTLTEADTMGASSVGKLSDGRALEVFARVSRQGDATHGEWLGRTSVVRLEELPEGPLSLLIDQAEDRVD